MVPVCDTVDLYFYVPSRVLHRAMGRFCHRCALNSQAHFIGLYKEAGRVEGRARLDGNGGFAMY